MAGGGQDPSQINGGDFLLNLLQKSPNHQCNTAPIVDSGVSRLGENAVRQNPSQDPAVTVLGPPIPFNTRNIPPPHLRPWSHSPNFTPRNFFGAIPQNPSEVHGYNFSQTPLPTRGSDYFHGHQNNLNMNQLRSFPSNPKLESAFEPDLGINFGSFPVGFRPSNTVNGKSTVLLNSSQEKEKGTNQLELPNVSNQQERDLPSHEFQNPEQDRRQSDAWGFRRPQGVIQPPGFPSKPKNNPGQVQPNYFASSSGDRRERSLPDPHQAPNNQLHIPVPPTGTKLQSVSATATEQTISELHVKTSENGATVSKDNECEDLEELITGSLTLEDNHVDAKTKRHKDYRSDSRGQFILAQRMRNIKSLLRHRPDIYQFNPQILYVYNSLLPPEEEKAKQRQLMALLERLVRTEWPEANLYLYGSCANSFGVSKSDIDVCLELKIPNLNKSEVLLKLAQIFMSNNLQNVQPLIHARVPIIKLLDPVTGISCDMCINNLLAVVNTKLLRDYAQIDVRLRQLAFIVKHWAKSRGVNETYQGTLSSYAYVLMCINFLQMQRPSILPCLQEMETTYAVYIENIHCSYFDKVEKLTGFGSSNSEPIAMLVWAFFHYWAYVHDYANNVISVRHGCLLRKHEKDWTRRIGNDRHLICIEDPFDRSHDLGRVVDKRSIRVLREEFERAAEIIQNDPNPFVTLFEPYIPPGSS